MQASLSSARLRCHLGAVASWLCEPMLAKNLAGFTLIAPMPAWLTTNAFPLLLDEAVCIRGSCISRLILTEQRAKGHKYSTIPMT